MSDCTKKETSLMYVFFCSFLVVTNIILFTVSEISGTSFIYQIINFILTIISCGVYGFTFVKGYKCGVSEKPVSTGQLYNEIKQLVSPYIAAVAVYWFVVLLLGDAEINPISLFRITVSYHFYVVLVLIQFAVLSAIVSKKAKNTNHSTLIVVSLIISILSTAFLPVKIHKFLFTSYLFCYTIGYCIGKNRNTFFKYAKTNFSKLIFTFVVTLLVAECITFIYVFTSGVFIVALKQTIICIYSPVAAAIILVFCSKYSNESLLGKINFTALSKTVYYIFLWHMLPIIATTLILIEHEEVHEFVGFIIRAASTLLLVYAIARSTYKKGIENGTV